MELTQKAKPIEETDHVSMLLDKCDLTITVSLLSTTKEETMKRRRTRKAWKLALRDYCDWFNGGYP